MKRKSSNKGFTLVEMIVVIAIAAIMFGLAAISMNIVTNSNVRADAKRMQSTLKTARMRAMAKGQDAGTVTITNENGAIYATIGTDADAEKKLICYSNVTYTGPTSIVFNTNGSVNTGADPTVTEYTLTFQRATRLYEVKVYRETGAIISKLL